MAKQKVSPLLSPPQTTNASENCAYCKLPISTRVTADSKSYCGKLCAALSPIIAVDDEDGIDPDVGVELLCDMVNDVLHDGPLPIPRKVRYRDALSAYELTAPAGCMIRTVVIDDEGTPDWVPDPTLHPSQEQVDHAVEDLLRMGDGAEGRP